MPDWSALFGDLSAAAVAMWIVALVLLVVLAVKAYPIVRRFVRTVDALADLPDFITRTDDRLEEHTAQLKNSHRTNLRDDVTAIETTVNATEEKLDALVLWQTGHERKAQEAFQRLDVLEHTIDPKKENP